MCFKHTEEWQPYIKPNGKKRERFVKYDKLISISAAERSHYTNDPDTAVRVCRYHILNGYRFTHCGLIMGEQQIKWAREKGYKILYITHDINNITINMLELETLSFLAENFVTIENTSIKNYLLIT